MRWTTEIPVYSVESWFPPRNMPVRRERVYLSILRGGRRMMMGQMMRAPRETLWISVWREESGDVVSAWEGIGVVGVEVVILGLGWVVWCFGLAGWFW